MKLKVAVITTIYFANSHADVIVSRWLEPRPTDAKFGWEASKSEIASLFIAQSNDEPLYPHHRDMGHEMALRFNIPVYPGVREALTLNTDELAVDAVLLIAEHGNYPYNAERQKLYPRRELFDEIVAMFRQAGRVVPVFCDKHLSWSPESAVHMFNVAQNFGIPLLAGSSLPHAGFQNELALPPNSKIEEVVAVFGCGPEVYGFHSLEMVQSILEKREGGETGIQSLCAYTGEQVWKAAEAGIFSIVLMEKALSQCRVSAGNIRHNCRATTEDCGEMCPISPVAFCIERKDGLRETHLMAEGHTRDFALAIRAQGESGEPEIYVAAAPSNSYTSAEFFPHFAILNRVIENFFVSGQSPVPLQRTLLTTLTMEACMRALANPSIRLETPALAISY